MVLDPKQSRNNSRISVTRSQSRFSRNSRISLSQSVHQDHEAIEEDIKAKIQGEQLSYVPQEQKRLTKQTAKRNTTKEITNEDLEAQDYEKKALANHLRSIAPFNGRWNVTKTINEGTFGVVFAVQDIVTGVEGVIKVAKSYGNSSAKWEAFILEKMTKNNETASVVRILDKGMLADQNDAGMEFMVLEKMAIPIMEYIDKFEGKERMLHVTYILLDMLKGINDMHCEGLLHRDLKPDNMGIMSKKQPFAILFDLGMVRMFTGNQGENRIPRSSASFRGTPEWASGHACKNREQSWLDDLIGWMYVAVELYDDTKNPQQPLPWTSRNTTRGIRFLKTAFCPARLLFKRCPHEFFAINAYLMTAYPFSPPDYPYLVAKLNEIIERLQNELGGPEKYNRYTRVGNPEKEKEKKRDDGETQTKDDRTKEEKTKEEKTKEEKTKEEKSTDDKPKKKRSKKNRSKEKQVTEGRKSQEKTKAEQTRQEKAKGSKPKEEQTSQGNSKEEKTKQERTKEDKPKEARTSQEKTKQERTRQEKTKAERTRQEKTKKEKNTEDKPKEERTRKDRTREEQVTDNRTKEERTKAERTSQEKTKQERTRQEKTKKDKNKEDKPKEERTKKDRTEQVTDNWTKEEKPKEERKSQKKTKTERTRQEKTKKERTNEDKQEPTQRYRTKEEKTNAERTRQEKPKEDKQDRTRKDMPKEEQPRQSKTKTARTKEERTRKEPPTEAAQTARQPTRMFTSSKTRTARKK
ncbi:unnamed protein product [Bursaphelenchus okinawaensis]|uniref:Protein kinase domain-containing protein n=1 Tax=Bursaphelenchus okinawaensis TaxID=465554 RepID=A0A811LK81_9BILA|nr:unnamed protein product [Bursaphelenchus okinawaensis]CAG9127414.1 unnamed protein product [Bursaphelenchus okinawaensis]